MLNPAARIGQARTNNPTCSLLTLQRKSLCPVPESAVCPGLSESKLLKPSHPLVTDLQSQKDGAVAQPSASGDQTRDEIPALTDVLPPAELIKRHFKTVLL